MIARANIRASASNLVIWRGFLRRRGKADLVGTRANLPAVQAGTARRDPDSSLGLGVAPFRIGADCVRPVERSPRTDGRTQCAPTPEPGEEGHRRAARGYEGMESAPATNYEDQTGARSAPLHGTG